MEAQSDRLADARSWRRVVEAAKYESPILKQIIGNAAVDLGRHVRLLREPEQLCDRIGGDARGLQGGGVGVVQRLQVVCAPPKLIRDSEVRLVHDDRARQRPAERAVAVLLPEGARGAVCPLQLRRVEVERRGAADAVRAGARIDVELSSAVTPAAPVVW